MGGKGSRIKVMGGELGAGSEGKMGKWGLEKRYSDRVKRQMREKAKRGHEGVTTAERDGRELRRRDKGLRQGLQ